MIEYLNWDSDFFGYKIGKIKISKPTDFTTISQLITNQKDYKLIYLVVDEEFHTLQLENKLEAAKIELVDSKTVFTQKIFSQEINEDYFKNIQLYLSTVTNQN